jgi:hypothetical protein
MKPILFILPLFICTAASAQLEKGNWNINTSANAPLNLNFETRARYKSYDFRFTPNIGYMLKDRWEIGGGPVLDFSRVRIKDFDGSYIYNSRSSSYGLNMYTRYYLKSSNKLVPYVVAGIQYMRTSATTTDFSNFKSTTKFNEMSAYGGVGLNWFTGPRSALFSELTYTGRWGSQGTGYTSGLNLNIGFRIFLGRKKK